MMTVLVVIFFAAGCRNKTAAPPAPAADGSPGHGEESLPPPGGRGPREAPPQPPPQREAESNNDVDMNAAVEAFKSGKIPPAKVPQDTRPQPPKGPPIPIPGAEMRPHPSSQNSGPSGNNNKGRQE